MNARTIGNKEKFITSLFGILSFVIPFILFWLTHSDSLGFADAGEFALVTKIAGIAHPPGFPAYVFTGWLWGKILTIFSSQHIINMVLFSIACTAIAAFLLFNTVKKILEEVFSDSQISNLKSSIISFTTSIAFCTGLTIWHWANSIEVYAFQILAMSILLHGLVSFNIKKKNKYIVIAGIGFAMGLANHHLTMIFFAPFILLFFKEGFFKTLLVTKGNENDKSIKAFSLVEIIKSKSFRLFCLVTANLTAVFYLWMLIRSGQEISFKFGNPDTVSRFFYHLTGGVWQEKTSMSVEGIISLRFPYFINLIWNQFFLFLPFVLIGLYELFRRNLFRFAFTILLYFLFLLIYQLRIDQNADTDAYMLLPFYLLSLTIAVGLYKTSVLIKPVIFILPLIIILQSVINFPKSDKRDFNVSESLMQQLDQSAPENSVILISDWTLVSQYYYFHIGENFRNDLIVLNYDLKFTNFKILETVYPKLYNYIKPEYDDFVQLLQERHPQEIYNTGCTLDTPELINAYIATVVKIQQYCNKNKYAFMCDPQAYLFLTNGVAMSRHAYMSGFLVSNIPTNIGKEFLHLPFKWLDSPLLLNEPAAVEKIVDFEAALDFSRNYYKQLRDTADYLVAEASYQKIKKLKMKMKSNMPFIYRDMK